MSARNESSGQVAIVGSPYGKWTRKSIAAYGVVIGSLGAVTLCPFNPRENSLLRPLQLTVSRCEHHSDSDHAGRDHSNGNWCHGRRLSSCLQRLERTISEITGKIGPVGCGLEGASQMRTAVSFRIRCAAVRTLLEGLNSWLLPHREALHSLVIQDEARAPY